MAKKDISKSVEDAIQSNFTLNKFKDKKRLSSKSNKFKTQSWIKVSKAFTEVTGLRGLPEGHISLLRGHSDTGKTTALIEAAVNAQKQNILPVFIVTEMKWSWEHAREIGLQFDEKVDEETGEVLDYEGFFIYADRDNMQSIEDVAAFMLDLMDEQSKGELPYNLCFFWDSIGSIPCEQSIKSNKNNNEWNAGAMSTQFSNNVNQRILLSRKESSPYTNTLVAINKVWTLKPESPMGKPKLQNKGGMAMWFDATVIATFGNVTNPGTVKLKAVSKGKQIEYAKLVNLQIEKNHISGISSKGKLAITTGGTIGSDTASIDKYKKDNRKKWSEYLGSDDFEDVQEGSMDEDTANYKKEE